MEGKGGAGPRWRREKLPRCPCFRREKDVDDVIVTARERAVEVGRGAGGVGCSAWVVGGHGRPASPRVGFFFFFVELSLDLKFEGVSQLQKI